MTRLAFAKRVQAVEPSAIKRMASMAASRPGAVSLGQGVPAMQTPSYIREGVIDLLSSERDISGYSLQPGLLELRQAVAERLTAKSGRTIDAENEVFITAGAMEALLAAMLTLVEKGDEVILFSPSYPSHIEQVALAEGTPVFVELEEKNGWSMPREALEKAVSDKTKVIVLCNPVNPTGKLFSKQELETIVEVAKREKLFVITDETYDFSIYDDVPYTSLLSFDEIKDQLIACYSFSKEFALTGWRVGYMWASPSIIGQALKVHDAAVICAPTVSQYAALTALKSKSRPPENPVKAELIKRRALMCANLDKLDDIFAYNKPVGAYYVFARYLKTDLDSSEFALKLLREAGVATVPGSAFGPNGEGHVRMSFGATEEQIAEAFERIEKWSKTL